MKALEPIVLPPLSALYGVITRARLALYGRGTFRVSELEVPVISVGNITTGGTGKTPLVEWLARRLVGEGRKVCILTRGYGRTNSGRRVIVSDAQKVLATPDEAGDEAFLLASKLKSLVAVISDADRIAAGKWAISQFGVDTLLLDDAFQHLRVHRDLNIITVDATNPWGGGHLLPFGSLREPLSGLERADCILLTRTEQIDTTDGIVTRLSKLSRGRPVFLSQMQTRGFSSVVNLDVLDSTTSPENPIAAFCGIGNPKAFFHQLQSEGCQLALTRAFPDHHSYNQAELRSLVQEAKKAGARGLVTTAKDAVKLSSFDFEIPCYVLEIEIAIDDEERLMEIIRQSVRIDL